MSGAPSVGAGAGWPTPIPCDRPTGVRVVRFPAGGLGHAQVEAWRESLPGAVDHDAVVLDLADVECLDWFGFEFLMDLVRDCRGEAVLCGLRPDVATLWTITATAGVVRRFADSAAAEAALARRQTRPEP